MPLKVACSDCTLHRLLYITPGKVYSTTYLVTEHLLYSEPGACHPGVRRKTFLGLTEQRPYCM